MFFGDLADFMAQKRAGEMREVRERFSCGRGPGRPEQVRRDLDA